MRTRYPHRRESGRPAGAAADKVQSCRKPQDRQSTCPQRAADDANDRRRGDRMTPPRRNLLQLAAGAAALPAMSRIASALDYPTRPVRWIVGFPPGGPNDITARIVAEFLS